MPNLDDALTALFEINMGVKQGERIVVFSDSVRPDERLSAADADRRKRLLDVAEKAAEFAQSTYGNSVFIVFPATSASGAEPPENLWRGMLGDVTVEQLAAEGLFTKLLAKQATAEEFDRAKEITLARKDAVADVVIALSNNSTSHTRFRALVNAAGGRFASLPHFDPEMFFSSMQVDWLALAARTSRLASLINEADEILVETKNGTRMRFGKRGRRAAGDDGLLTAPGSFGNLPAGEVYLAPLEGTSEGVMVLEYAPTRRLANPLRLIVENGNVVEIIGDEPHKLTLEKKFGEGHKNRNIAELGIGTNDKATRPDNVLEAEKILGTIHIALGDNSGFGGTIHTPFHEDYVFYKPTLTAVLPDGSKRTVLQDGQLLI